MADQKESVWKWIAGGCVSGSLFKVGQGNIMSGVALMSVGNLLFFVVVLLSNWVTTHFYLMGGSMKDLAWALNVLKK